MMDGLATGRKQKRLVADAGHRAADPARRPATNIELLERAQRLPDDERAALLGDVRAELNE